MKSKTILFILFLLHLCLGSELIAQIKPYSPDPEFFNTRTPDFVFRVRTNDGYGGHFPKWKVLREYWDKTYNYPFGSLTRRAIYVGNASDNSLTITSIVDQSGTETIKGGVGLTVNAFYNVQIYVKNAMTAHILTETNGNVENTSNALYPRWAMVGPYPFGSDILLAEQQTGNCSITDSRFETNSLIYTPLNPPGKPTNFEDFPGIDYYLVKEFMFGAATHINGPSFTGLTHADGSMVITAAVGGNFPEAVINGPLVNGSPKDPVDLNDPVQLINESYDPDDGTTPLIGIWEVKWTVTQPDKQVKVYKDPIHFSGLNLSGSKQGQWWIKLEVEDNEGMKDTAHKFYDVGIPRCEAPGQDAPPELTMEDDWFKTMVNPGSGNANSCIEDPVPTRGYPLTCNIHLNTQSRLPSNPFEMGNANFTYGIRIEQAQVNNQTHWFLIDGDGAEFDFGEVSNPPAAPPGFFSTLTQTPTGFELSNAQAPEQIEKRGNFTYEFNTNGQLLKIIDPAGNEQVLSYNIDDSISQVLDVSSNKVLSFEYDLPGEVARIVENNGGAIHHLSYVDGLLTNVVLKDSASNTIRSVDFTYDSNQLLQTAVLDGDPDKTFTYTYQEGGNNVKLANIETPRGNTNLNYSLLPPTGAVYRTQRTNAKGGVTFYDFDGSQNLIKITDPAPKGTSNPIEQTFTYDANNNMTSATDGAVLYTMTYNSNGQLERIEDQTGRFKQYAYAGNDLLRVEDNAGLLMEYEYNNPALPHHITGVKDGALNLWGLTYNSYGQVIQITPPVGSPQGSVDFTYDETLASPTYGYLLYKTNGAGDLVTYDAYSLIGDLTSFSTYPTTGVNNTTTFEFDPTHSLTKKTFHDGKFMERQYVGGQLNRIVDEGGKSTDFAFCPISGLLTQIQAALGKAVSWTLDTDFAVTLFTDPNLNSVEYQYSDAKELRRVIFPDGSEYKYDYDYAGRLKKIKDPAYHTGTLTYNGSNDVVSIAYDIGSEDNLDYAYHPDGTLATLTSHAGVITYAYGPDRRIHTVTYDYSIKGLTDLQIVEYGYTPDGAVKTLTWKNGAATVGTWTYFYDAAGRVSMITNSFGESINYSYDGEGKILSQTNGNNTATFYEYYEPRNWVNKIQHQSSGTPFEEYSLIFDNGSNTVGNVTQITELDGSNVIYSYDDLYRLLSETRTGTSPLSKTYTYDLAGNVLTMDGSVFASYNNLNEIDILNGGEAIYDAKGNIITLKLTGLSPASYYYNNNNLMTRHKNNAGFNVGLRIDGHGRRAFATNRCFIFDGQKVIGEIDPSGNPLLAYTWGPDGLACQRNMAAANSFYHHYGPQGETRRLSDSSGNVTDTYIYTAYGRPVSSSGSTQNHYLFAGKWGAYTEGSTGIIQMGARAYHPYLMRWMQRDPIAFDGGVNRYAFANNNPMKQTNPSGVVPVAFHQNLAVTPDGLDMIKDLKGLITDPNHILGFGLLHKNHIRKLGLGINYYHYLSPDSIWRFWFLSALQQETQSP